MSEQEILEKKIKQIYCSDFILSENKIKTGCKLIRKWKKLTGWHKNHPK